jgi:hypothetical protein
MPLCSKIQVEMPRTGVTIRRSGPYHTVFKRIKSFRNDKGTPCSERVIIGKMDPDTGKLIPNDRYWEYYPLESGEAAIMPEYSSCRSVGGAYLFDRVSRQLGLKEILVECLGEKRASLALTAALHMVARGNVFEDVLSYCEKFTLSEPPLSSQSASDLFASIDFGERMEFFKSWMGRFPPGDYLAYDSTSMSTCAKGIVKSEPGFNKDGERLPQINFGCFFSQESGLPMFYVIYAGSIVDKSHLPCMMAYNSDLGIKDVCFVMDRGYCSTANVRRMVEEGHHFIMGADIVHKTTSSAVDILRERLAKKMELRIAAGVYGKSIRGCFYGATSNMHVYYSPGLANDHREELIRLVESKEEKLAQLKQLTRKEAQALRRYFVIDLAKDGSFTYSRDDDKINDLVANFGYFCLLSNTGLNTAEILEAYRRKDVIEKGFDDLKNNVEMKRLRTHNQDTTEGKMFCAFIALIVVSQIGMKLKELMKKKSWSKEKVITEMEKISVITGRLGNRLADPVTKRQRSIMEPFGLDEEDLKAYVKGDMS